MPSRDEAGLPSTREPEPLTLADYVALIWRYKWLVVIAALVAGVTGFALSMTGPRVYESVVTFAATQSKIGEGGQGNASTASFRPMVESLTTAAAVLRDVGLDKPPHNLRPVDFLQRIMSVSEVRGTNLMRVTVVYHDSTAAAAMANSVGDRAVRTARKVSATEAAHARDMIKEQVDLAYGRLKVADARLLEYRRQAQVEAVKKDVEAQLGGPQSGGRVSLLDLLVKIASERARLTVMERDLANRNPVDILKKTIDSEPILAEAVRQTAPGSGSTLGTQLRSESINETYRTLDGAAAATRSNLAALEKQKAELVNVRRLDARTMPVLNHLYEVESELDLRMVERELAEKVYVDISQRYEAARLQVVGRSAELSVIDPAVPADRPVSRQVARNTVVAAIVGFCLAVAALLLWHATRQIQSARVQ